MLSKAALVATAAAVASIKGVAAKDRSADLSGVGFNALHINSEATAVVDGGTYDARNIVAKDNGNSIDDGAYGLFVDTDATVTVCDAKLIKGGTMNAEDGTTQGRGGVYVASGATLNIVDGVIEGGNSEASKGSYGIYASYEANEEANSIVITGGEILGGMILKNGKHVRGVTIFAEGGGTVDVYGGDIGDKRTWSSLAIQAGLFGELPAGNKDATVNIHGGNWQGTEMYLEAYNNSMAYLNIFGEDLNETPLPNDDMILVEGHLCDGSSFKQNIHVYAAASAVAQLSVVHHCSGSTAPTFDDCGSGKKKKSG